MSQYFEEQLSHYDPNVHWTSPLRTRAGYKSFGNCNDSAAFTFMEKNISSQITEILALKGHMDAISGKLNGPVYHVEVVVNPDRRSTSFPLRLSQLERVRSSPKYEVKPRADAK